MLIVYGYGSGYGVAWLVGVAWSGGKVGVTAGAGWVAVLVGVGAGRVAVAVGEGAFWRTEGTNQMPLRLTGIAQVLHSQNELDVIARQAGQVHIDRVHQAFILLVPPAQGLGRVGADDIAQGECQLAFSGYCKRSRSASRSGRSP